MSDLAYSERMCAEAATDAQGNPRPEGLKLKEQFGKAKRYTDFREMLAKEKSIDGVVVATPDHYARRGREGGDGGRASTSMCKSRSPPPCMRPRMLRELALKNPKLVTQMGNQGHSSEGARLINEWIGAGIIGPVHEVHVWTNRPVVYWPQGLARPTSVPPVRSPGRFRQSLDIPVMCRMCSPPPWAAAARRRRGSIGTCISGPIAEDVPYHPIYHPFNWRGWLDFGCGRLGDMGAHLIDHPFWALGLAYPASIEATSTQWGTMHCRRQIRGCGGAPGRARANPCRIRSRLACTINSPPAARSRR